MRPGRIRARLLVYPPATGFQSAFDAEARELEGLGIQIFRIQPPQNRQEFATAPRGLQHPLEERKLWQMAGRDLEHFLEVPFPPEIPLILMGFNLGGSIASYLASRFKPSALIATGSIPQLSRFWMESPHPVAMAQRARGDFDVEACRRELSRLDLVYTLSRARGPSLIQFGKRDEWLEPVDIEALQRVARPPVEIEWTDDDHDMLAPASIRQRVSFIRKILPP